MAEEWHLLVVGLQQVTTIAWHFRHCLCECPVTTSDGVMKTGRMRQKEMCFYEYVLQICDIY